MNQREDQFARWGSWILFLGVACWSINAPLVKYIPLDPMLLGAVRASIAGIALLPFLKGAKLTFSKWTIAYLISYAGICLCVVMALKLVSAPIAIGMQYVSIIWLFLIAVIAKKKKPSVLNITPIVVIITGVVVFMMSGVGSGEGGALGVLIVLLEGIFFAGVNIFSKKAAGENPLGMTAIANLFTAAFIFIALPPRVTDIVAIEASQWIPLLILGVVQVGAGYGFYNIGLKYVEPHRASMIAPWEMILGSLWVIIFLRDYPSWIEIIGFIILAIGMFAAAKCEQIEQQQVLNRSAAADAVEEEASEMPAAAGQIEMQAMSGEFFEHLQEELTEKLSLPTAKIEAEIKY